MLDPQTGSEFAVFRSFLSHKLVGRVVPYPRNSGNIVFKRPILDPNLNSIRGEPEFQIVVAEIQADMASKMQRVREMEQSGEIGPVPGVVIEPK